MSEIERLLEPLRAALAEQADALGLRAEAIAIEPVLNWGGFMNRSFRVGDGGRTLFAKLTSYPDIRRGLELWRSVASDLESRYHAPRLNGWIDLADTGFAGPVFEWIDGRTITHLDDSIAAEVSEVITRLHGDDALAARLPGPAPSCADAYLETYHRRFTEDLAFVAADPPPFVDAALIAWMRERITSIETRVRELAAFHAMADRPVHGDLWLENTWLARDGAWYVLDWDGLGLGDPVMDWTMLFGPTRERPHAADEAVVLAHARLTDDERARLAVYAEASQLDWVLDPLADWVQSGDEPEHGERIRAANERTHARALEAYRAR